jgi:hypothetical protein
MSGHEAACRKRLLVLAQADARERDRAVRLHPESFDALTLRLLRLSRQPGDRAAAVLVWSQRRPEAFLRHAPAFLRDDSPEVRAAVIEGLGNACLLAETAAAWDATDRLLDRGEQDRDLSVREVARTTREILAIEDEGADEASPEVSRRVDWSSVRVRFLQLLVPELGPAVRPLLDKLGAGKPMVSTVPSFGLAFSPGEVEKDLMLLLRELTPLADDVLDAAGRFEVAGGSPVRFALKQDHRVSSAVKAVEMTLKRHGRAGGQAWRYLERAIREARRSPHPGEDPDD